MSTVFQADRYRVNPNEFELNSYDPEDTDGCDERFCATALHTNAQRIAELQAILSAESKQAVLVILESMDTGGKDPIIRDVLSAANAQYCRVTAFKKPTEIEQQHDRFWRFHSAVPAHGEIGVFNRAYYDETIARLAHDELSAAASNREWRQMNDFELMLSE